MQRRAALVAAAERSRHDVGMAGDEFAKPRDIAGVDRCHDRVGGLGRRAHRVQPNPTDNGTYAGDLTITKPCGRHKCRSCR
jgi:hypothetical protein